jgi:tRNA(Ile)-lysidine synthase
MKKEMELRNLKKEKTYLLAASGGIDSMVMADLFLKNGISFQIAHCNFSLRGEESDMDEQLVKDWCAANAIPYHTTKFDTALYATEHSLSIQESARVLRYDYFNQLLETHQLAQVATAHHLDDNIETVFFHFLRGTGIKGLTGIPALNGRIVRPLLHIPKEEIIAYATAHNIPYRNDSSNAKETYTRNKIRNTLLPLIEGHFPQVRQTLSSNIERFTEVNEIYQRSVETFRKKLTESRGKDFYIAIRKLKHVSPLHTITYELVKPYHFSFDQALELLRLKDSMTGSFIESQTHRIIRNRDHFIITEKAAELSEMILIEAAAEKVSCADFELTFKLTSEPSDLSLKTAFIEFIDAGGLKYPLLLRK